MAEEAGDRTGDREAGAHARSIDERAARRTGAAVGIGLMGAIDEIVFHQLLQWHHFYLWTDAFWRIFSDGLFHLFTTAMLLLGAILLWRLRSRLARLPGPGALLVGVLVGMGAFQLFDGVVNHKLLRLHPVRQGVMDPLPYDLGWIASALVLLALGWWLERREGRRRAQGDARR